MERTHADVLTQRLLLLHVCHLGHITHWVGIIWDISLRPSEQC